MTVRRLVLQRLTRSNCLLAALCVRHRLGGRLVVVRQASWRHSFPHFGVLIRPGLAIHFQSDRHLRRRAGLPFRPSDLLDVPILWFRGRLRRAWVGEQ